MGLFASQGEQGERGKQGPKGDTGVQGPPGNYKKELDFILGSEDTTRGNSGQSRAISKILHNDKPTLAFNYETDFAGGNLFFGNTQINGALDATSFTLNGTPFTGPKGDQGDKGDTGAQGPKGDRGLKGDQGAQGPKGDKGDTGALGQKGDKGAPGLKGEQGPRGETGPSLGPYYVRIGGGSDYLDSKQFSESRKGVHTGSENLNKQWSYDPMSRHLRSISDDVCLTNRDNTFVLEGCRDNDELQVVTFRDDKRLQIMDKCFDKNSSTRAYNCDGNQDFQRAVFRNVNFKPSASSTAPTVTQTGTKLSGTTIESINTAASSECTNTCATLVSKLGVYEAKLSRGRIVITERATNTEVWSSPAPISIKLPYKLVMQYDGNLVIYDADGKATWSSNSAPAEDYQKGPYRLVLQDDGNLVIYDKDNKPVWARK